MERLMATLLAVLAAHAHADPTPELVFQVKAAVVKVHTTTRSGGHGVGTGVVVAPDHVATNCHVLANASGITVRKFGENHAPVALKADWKHDVCLLRFQGLPMKPLPMADGTPPQYEQPVFSVGFPGGVPKPLVTTGRVKALYAHDDGQIIRSSASFRMGASGSPLLDESGRLLGISTFKSPGRDAYFYHVPVKWVKQLLDAPESTTVQQEDLPFWDAPEALRPFFMRVVPYLQAEQWADLEHVAMAWTRAEPSSAEAWYMLGLAQGRQGKSEAASQQLHKALALHPRHPATLYELALLAAGQGDQGEVEKIRTALGGIDRELAERLPSSPD